MLRRLWAMVQKEFTQTVRDRATLAMLLTMPMLQLFLFGFAIDMNVDHIPTIVADQSLDAASRAYVEALAASGYFDIIAYVADQAAVVQAIDAGRAQAGIVIPPGFSARVERSEASVLFLVDGSDLFTMQSAYNMGRVIARNHASEIMFEQVARTGIPLNREMPLDLRTRILYNPDMAQLWFVLPGLAAMIMQTESIAITALAVVREREIGTMEQLLVTPIRPLEMILGKVAPNIVIAMINMLTVVGIGVFVFRVPFKGSLALFGAVSLLFILAGLGLGLLISTIARTANQCIQMIMGVILIGLVLGGFVFPRYTMPPALYALGYLFPMTYFLPIARSVITKGVGIAMLKDSILPMAAYSVAVLLIAASVFRKRLD